MNGIVDLRFFDCNVRLGRLSAPTLGNWLDVAGLLAEMAYFEIAESLVVSTYAKEHRAALGNERLLDELSDHPALHPCFVLAPPHPGVDASEEEQISGLIAQGVRAVRLYTNSLDETVDSSIHARDYGLMEAVVGPLLGALERRRVPLFLDIGQARWEELYTICAGYPQLPVIVTNMPYSDKRLLFAGFARYPNLRAELSGYHVHMGLEEVCSEFGAHRLLFGTRLPAYTPAPAVAMVRYADISPEEQQAIAGENLRQLLAQVDVGA